MTAVVVPTVHRPFVVFCSHLRYDIKTLYLYYTWVMHTCRPKVHISHQLRLVNRPRESDIAYFVFLVLKNFR